MDNDVIVSKCIRQRSGGKYRWHALCLVLITMMCLAGCKNTDLSAGEWHVTRNNHRIKNFVKDWCITQEADCFYRDNMNLGGNCTVLITLECDSSSLQNAYVEFLKDGAPMSLGIYSNLALFVKISTGETPRFETTNFGKGLKVNYDDLPILESIFQKGETIDVRVLNVYGYGEFSFKLDTENYDEACKLLSQVAGARETQ